MKKINLKQIKRELSTAFDNDLIKGLYMLPDKDGNWDVSVNIEEPDLAIMILDLMDKFDMDFDSLSKFKKSIDDLGFEITIPANDDYSFISGLDEVPLTDGLINMIMKKGDWGSRESLIQARDMGFKWNTKRKSIVSDWEEV